MVTISMGEMDGASEGLRTKDGDCVGTLVEGLSVGDLDGIVDGFLVGLLVGKCVGNFVGFLVVETIGASVG